MAQYTAARWGLAAEGPGLSIVDPLPARELTGSAIVLGPFRPSPPIGTMLIGPSGKPASHLVARFVTLLKAERDTMTAASSLRAERRGQPI
jgi:hypothetical protein